MLKKVISLFFLGMLSVISNAKDLDILIFKTKNCKTDDCIYSHDFMDNTNVKKAILNAFTIQGVISPQWLTSNSVVSTPAEYGTFGGMQAIKLDLCKPHFCGTDNLEGFYLIKENVFLGSYTFDGNEAVYVGPDK